MSHPGKLASSPTASGANRTVFIVEKRGLEGIRKKEGRKGVCYWKSPHCQVSPPPLHHWEIRWSCTYSQVLSRVTLE